MTRRILWLGLSFLLVASLVLSSCAKEEVVEEEEEEEEEPITITWWLEALVPEEVEALERNLIKPFEEIYPHIDIDASVQPDLFEVLRLALPVGEGPDIVLTMGPAEAALYAAEGLLAPLDGHIVEAGLDELIAPLALSLGMVEGKIYSIPKTFESMGIIYNKSLFDEYGWEPATNRQEFVALMEAIKAEGILPVVAGNFEWRPTNEWFVTVYLNHYAGPENIYKALTGQLAWDAPIFVEAIEMFKQDFLHYWTKQADYPVLTFPDVMIQLATREAAMTVVGSWGFGWLADPTYWPSDDQWGWAPFPSLRQGVEYPSVAIGVGTTMSVSSLSPHIDEAARFIVWLLSYKEGIAAQLLDHPGEWIVAIEIPEELIPSGVDPVFMEHVLTQSDLIDKGAYGYTTWTWLAPEAWLWCYEGVEEVWLGSLTAEAYMEKWDEIFQRELAAGLIPPVAPRD
ncbi:hypothetical protein ES705_36868 [subsurface metagenome]